MKKMLIQNLTALQIRRSLTLMILCQMPHPLRTVPD